MYRENFITYQEKNINDYLIEDKSISNEIEEEVFEYIKSKYYCSTNRSFVKYNHNDSSLYFKFFEKDNFYKINLKDIINSNKKIIDYSRVKSVIDKFLKEKKDFFYEKKMEEKFYKNICEKIEEIIKNTDYKKSDYNNGVHVFKDSYSDMFDITISGIDYKINFYDYFEKKSFEEIFKGDYLSNMELLEIIEDKIIDPHNYSDKIDIKDNLISMFFEEFKNDVIEEFKRIDPSYTFVFNDVIYYETGVMNDCKWLKYKNYSKFLHEIYIVRKVKSESYFNSKEYKDYVNKTAREIYAVNYYGEDVIINDYKKSLKLPHFYNIGFMTISHNSKYTIENIIEFSKEIQNHIDKYDFSENKNKYIFNIETRKFKIFFSLEKKDIKKSKILSFLKIF